MNFSERLKLWQGGEPGFYQWVCDIQPMILTRSNRYELFAPTARQKKFIRNVLAVDKAGLFKHSISLNIEPRRHGKSTVFSLITLWLFTSRLNYVIRLLGSTESHSFRVQFQALKKIINNTAMLSLMIPESNQFMDRIEFPEIQSQIQFSASNASAAFGDKLNCLWVSDLHSFVDLSTFNALQASLLDSEDSLIFIDSNVDSTGGPVDSLEQAAVTDKQMFCQSTSYRDFDHFAKEAPAWIDRDKAARLEKTTLPADFKRDVLGQRSDAKNGLFSSEIISLCRDSYRVPVADVEALAQGRAYKIGAGLDRAKSLIAGSRGDYTVWTVVMKCATQGGEPEYFLLNQVRFLINSAKSIKSVILEDDKRYGIDNVIFENFETSDIHSWALENRIPCELISPHSTVQESSFPEMFRVMKEGRLHFPAGLDVFESELSTFIYTRRQNGTYAFGHSGAKFHDDTVYSVNWAFFSLRKEVLNLFEIDTIQCDCRGGNRHMCFMMGGGLELYCKGRCAAYGQVEEMWRQYRLFNEESEIKIPEFFHAMVKVTGAVVYQSA